MHMSFLAFSTPVLTQLFFPKPSTTFPICFCSSDSQKYAGKKVCLNRGSNSQPPGHESHTLTTEPPGWGWHTCFYSSHDCFVCLLTLILKNKE